MSKHLIRISKKNIVLLIIVFSCVFLYAALTIASSCVVKSLPQNKFIAEWDDTGRSSVIGVYLSDSSCMSLEDIRMLEYQIQTLLIDDSIDVSDNARYFASGYSLKSSVTLNSKRAGYVSCEGYAVNGDFFKFHRFKLVSGSYFDSDDVNHKSIVIDKDAAWKLFGAVDVDGMSLEYNGEEYVVAGVVEVEDGYLTKPAGALSGIVYMPIESMCDEEDYLINTYEIILPNPVKDYAYNLAKKAFERVVTTEYGMSIVDYSSRYNLMTSLKRVKDWKNKGMSFTEVRYPYWENIAVGIENVVDMLTFFRAVFIIPAILITVIEIILFHPLHRLKLLCLKLIDKIRR